jgi:hypothetical protein
MAVILNNKEPCYVVLSFSEYEKMQAARAKLINATFDDIIIGKSPSSWGAGKMIILTAEDMLRLHSNGGGGYFWDRRIA